MAFRYSLFVNGKPLGPYEKRMIVGMRVKKIVTSEQIVLRDDGVEMSVAALLQNRDETTPTAQTAKEPPAESYMGAPSTGMWPQFNVRYGGGPMKPGAWGFSGNGHISYHGDSLRFKGNRRNKNFGMSRQEESLPISAIASSRCDDCFLELALQPSMAVREHQNETPLRVEFATAQEASELLGLLTMRPGELPRNI